MEWSTVSVATGALGPVMEKLTTLLGKEQYKSHLGTVTRSDLEFIKSKLASLHSILLRIWEREDLGAECKEWMMEARALSYDMEDDIDDLMLGLEHSDIGHGELNKLFRNVKMRVEDVSRRCREEWKPAAPDEAISISKKHSKPSPADPRARFLHKDASELVGMDRPSRKLQRMLRSRCRAMICIIHGFAGTGKTTLADFVYHKIRHEFECCAFVSLSKSPDILEALGAILTQVTEGVNSVERTCTEATPEENLIHDIFMFLYNKRYLIIVDDIWLWQSWEIIRRALPNGNQKCRIIATTRVNAIAEKCCLTEEGATIYRHSGINDWAAATLSLATLDKNASHKPDYKSAAIKLWPDEGEEENVPYLLLLQEAGDVDAAELRRRRILNQVVAPDPERHQRNKEFYLHRIIADMCCGMALAVWCLSRATVARLGYYKWWKPVDDKHRLQKKLWEVLLGGLLRNEPTLKPMVESLRLGYDDLPVHLKTCLLYCSIFPASYEIERHGLVRKWIAQGFFPQGPEHEKEAAAEACLDELVSRGLLQQEPASPRGEKTSSYCSVHPMMRAFLLWRSKEANFATCLELPPHDFLPSDAAAASPRFVGLHAGPDTIAISAMHRAVSTISAMHRAISLVVFGYSSSSSRTHTDDGCLFPWQQLERVRVLSIEDNRVPVRDTDLVAICTRMLQLRHLGLKGMPIRVVPPEIGRLQNLETLDFSNTGVRELPKQIGKLHHLKTLNVPAMVRELPWLSSSSVSVLVGGEKVELPQGVSAVMESLKKDITSISSSPGEDLSIVLYVRSCQPLHVPGIRVGSRHNRVPEWIKQHLADISFFDIRLCKLEQDDLEFLSTMPNLQFLTLRLLYHPREPMGLPRTGFSVLERFCLDCHHRGHVGVPGWVKQHLANVSSLDIRLCKLEDDDLEFLRTMSNLQHLTLRFLYLPREPTVVLAGTGFSRLESFCLDCHSGHMRVPGWVKQHLANVSSLDIRLCQLVDDDLDFMRNKMPYLQLLILRLEVLPSRKPVAITGEGFLMLKSFCLDCRLPMVTFQQGAMPKLEHLEFKFYTSRALTIEDPVGIRHLLSLKRVVFQCSPRYKSNAPGISVVINKVREEAKEHPNKITISINGKDEEVIQEKKEATKTTSTSDTISEENIVTSGGTGGSSGASMIKTCLRSPYDNGSDDEKGSIIPVKSYYPFGVTE